MNGAVPTAAGASIGKVGARTVADYITVFQATLAVTCDIATAVASDGCPPLDMDATLDT